ncbi:MAG: T9SS type A sorting domain-containing protein [Flavobacteriaceae bacterium]|nr:T9SS type A sorting domain-containing protein [Flavobacteriaceae bacterium]
MILKKLHLTLLLFFIFLNFAFSQTNTWTGAVDNNWNTAGNWSLAVVPMASHDVIIPTGFTVNLNASATVNSIQVQGTSTFNWSNQLSIAAASNFGANSIINWSTNILNGGGTLTNQGTLNLITGSTKAILGASVLNNEGVINLQNGGDLYITSGIVNNQATGVIDIQASSCDISYGSAGLNILNNSGIIKRTSSGTANIIAELNNAGTINVESGELRFTGLNKNLTGGIYNVTTGASLSWSGTVTCSGVLTGILDGPLNWNNEVIITTTATFDFSGTDVVNWTTNNLNGGGTLTNLGILNLTTASSKGILGFTTFNNEGVINLQNGGDLYITSGIVNNQNSGVIDIQANASNITYGSVGSNILNNAGIVKKTTSTGTAVIVAELNNTGTISVENGDLTFQGLNKNLTGGIYNVFSGASFSWGGPVTCSGTLTGTLNGPINWDNLLTVISSATFNFSGPAGVNWTVNNLTGGGALTNQGLMNLTTAASKSILGNTILNNEGTITLQNGGDIYIIDGTINNQMSAIIDIQAAGSDITYSGGTTHILNNMGLIRRTTTTGIANIVAELNNTGTISIENGDIRFQGLNKNLTNGTYNVFSGSTLQWNGTVTCLGTLTGALNGPIVWDSPVIIAGATTATFNFSGSTGVNWNSNNLDGGGTLINQSPLNLTSGATKSIIGNTTLNNEGSMTIQSGGDLNINTGIVNNQSTGIIDIQADASNISYAGGTQHILNNAGLLTKTSGTGTAVIFVETTNTGIIDTASGEIEFNGVNSLNNTTTGIIKGIATIDLPTPADFINNGTFSPGASPGTLTVIGDFESTSSSVLDIELNGYNAGTEYDVLAITGNAIMEGNVNITMGFEGFINDTFTVATTSGTITTCNLLPPNNPVHNGIEYEFSADCATAPNQLVLTITQKTDIQPPTVLTQNITVYLGSGGTVTILPSQVDNGSFDNFSLPANLVFSLDITSFNCSNIGNNTVLLTVTDEAGNSASNMAIVTVLGTDTTFAGGTWDNGTPNAGSNAIINEAYTTSTFGSIETCTCEITPAGDLTINANEYLLSANNITVNGSLFIAHQGSMVQEYDFAQVIKNGTIETEIVTPNLASRDFMILGSPTNAETRNGVFASAFLVLDHNTLNFVPNPDVASQFPMAENFADDNYDNWVDYNGSIDVGEGYIVRPQAGYGQPGGIFTMIYEQGTLNNGTVTFPIIYNTPGPTSADNRNASPNILANPYASAIDADLFLTANPLFNEVYFWEHLTPPSPNLPGAGSMNFSMEDISMYNLMGGTAAASDPTGTNTQPNGVISTAQGFAIKATGAGTAIFNNTMRLTTGNTTLRSQGDKKRLWLKVNNTTYSLQNSCLIGFTENATNAIDSGYDSNRLASIVSIYSGIEGLDVELGIQSLGNFNSEMIIPIGFSTLVEEVAYYKISLSNVDSDLLLNNDIYLYDSFEDSLSLLNEDSYSFASGAGNFPNRFKLLFKSQNILEIRDSSLKNLTIYPNPATTELFIKGLHETGKLTLIDALGRKVMSTDLFGKSVIEKIEFPQLPFGIYTVLIETNKDKVTKKLLIE